MLADRHSFMTSDGTARTFDYIVGGELPQIKLWWVDENDNLYNLDGYTGSVVVSKGSTTYLTKTSGVVTASGYGVPSNGTPNFSCSFSDGELDGVIPNPGIYVLTFFASSTNNADLFLTAQLRYSSPGSITWTYSGDPSDSTRDAVRFMVGDTNDTDQLISDQEIDYLIFLNGDVRTAAAEVALSIAARFARCMDRSVGSLSKAFSMRFDQYQRLAEEIRRNTRSTPASPWSSGWSKSAKAHRESDPDREERFRLGQMDNHGFSGYEV